MIGGVSSESEISYLESIEAAVRQLSSSDKGATVESIVEDHSSSAYAKFKDWTQSMKGNKSLGNNLELSSFSPISYFTSGAGRTNHPETHGLNNLLNSEWLTSDLGLDPDIFLAPEA